ncbi:MAG: HAD-IA family hydrolase [Desulfatirhabdiaceae bacterium]
MTGLDKLPSCVKVVSFDVFDTILIRLVPSEQVVRIAIKKLCECYYKETFRQLSFSDIYKHRIHFQQKMNEKARFQEAEWTVSQWLHVLADDFEINTEILFRIGMQSEIEAEFLCLKKADGVNAALSLANACGLTSIAVSDTWLDQNWLQHLLIKFDLHFDHIFSSGTMGLSKRNGTIFQPIQEQLGLEPRAFYHMGDDLKADFLRPRLSGWRSAWMPKPGNPIQIRRPAILKKLNKTQKPWQNIVKLLTVEPADQSADIFYRMAYDYLAPLLIIFSIVQWRRFREQKIELVYYIARDARTLLDVYDILADVLPGSCPRRYIRLSRRAIAIAHPDDLLQNVRHLAGKMGKKKIAHWLGNFTVSARLKQDILTRAGLDEQAVFTPSTRQKLIDACHHYLPEITAEQTEQKTIIRDYLLQEAGDIPIRRIGIVDSGWACTTQDIIQYLLPEAEIVSGMYLGVSHQGMRPNDRNIKYGLLRDDFRRCRHHNILESTAGVIRIWETLLREPVESTRFLHLISKGQIVAVANINQTIGEYEKRVAEVVVQGVRQGTTARLKGVSTLPFLDTYQLSDFEIAATMIALNVSTYPSRHYAKSLLRVGFEEGAAGGFINSIGTSGITNGTAWYPGLLSSIGLNWTTSLIIKLLQIKLLYPFH